MKRSRRNSDVSNSDISGYGDDDARLQLLPTPSPRLTPSESRNENQGSHGSGLDPPNRPSDQHVTNPVSGTSLISSNSSTVSDSTHWRSTISGRRKRKQAKPVHPSIVERIPGITLRIQRQPQGDVLQVEILKNLDDYRAQPGGGGGGDQDPTPELQGTQDLQKIKESIESGRHGNLVFPAVSRQLPSSPDLRGATSHHPDSGATSSGKLVPRRNQSLSSSLASLTWTSSNGGSAESLATIADMVDARSLPLTWENFSTRDCEVNKVVGKYDAELGILEEVVQDAVARKNHANQQLLQQQQDREQEESPTPIQSPRKPLSTSTASGVPSTAATTVASNLRSTRTSSAIAPAVSSRFVPVRSTRSRRSVSDKYADAIEAELNHRRKKKMEKQRISKDEEVADEDMQPEEDEDEAQMSDVESTSRTIRRARAEDIRDVEDGDGMKRRRRSLQNRQLDLNGKDGASEGRGQSSKQQQPSATNNKSRGLSNRYRHSNNVGSEDDVHSSSEDNDAVGDGDYRDKNYKTTVEGSAAAAASVGPIRRKRTLSDSRLTNVPGQKSNVDSKAPTSTGRSGYDKATPGHSSAKSAATATNDRRKKSAPISIPVLAGDGTLRNKKLWSRGRNTRKEDEVVDTTSDPSSESDGVGDDDDDDDANENSEMPLVSHPQSSRSMPITANERYSARNAAGMSSGMNTGSSSTTTRTSAQSTASGVKDDVGGRTRTRARSVSNTISTEKFYESALDTMKQKQREAVAKKKAEKAGAEERERMEREESERREREAKDRQETLARLQEQGKAQKIEASNLPKSSKSLPGRVLRRYRTDGSTDEGGVDPDCTSCRLELSSEDKAVWKAACERREISLPKTWGTHAILCTTCRQQYSDHHSRCTACFYVPVRTEMATSGASCSRCKAGTWLTEAVRTSGEW